MDEQPKKTNHFRTIYLPLILATVFGVVIYAFVPQVGFFGAFSAWMGTLIFTAIWGSFYS